MEGRNGNSWNNGQRGQERWIWNPAPTAGMRAIGTRLPDVLGPLRSKLGFTTTPTHRCCNDWLWCLHQLLHANMKHCGSRVSTTHTWFIAPVVDSKRWNATRRTSTTQERHVSDSCVGISPSPMQVIGEDLGTVPDEIVDLLLVMGVHYTKSFSSKHLKKTAVLFLLLTMRLNPWRLCVCIDMPTLRGFLATAPTRKMGSEIGFIQTKNNRWAVWWPFEVQTRHFWTLWLGMVTCLKARVVMLTGPYGFIPEWSIATACCGRFVRYSVFRRNDNPGMDPRIQTAWEVVDEFWWKSFACEDVNRISARLTETRAKANGIRVSVLKKLRGNLVISYIYTKKFGLGHSIAPEFCKMNYRQHARQCSGHFISLLLGEEHWKKTTFETLLPITSFSRWFCWSICIFRSVYFFFSRSTTSMDSGCW